MIRNRGTAVLAVAAALTLGACGSTGNPTAAPATASSSSPATGAPASSSAAQPPGSAAVVRCTTAELVLSVGTMTQTASGQDQVPLVYTNTSRRSCDLHGVPGVDLTGPADPTFGPTYSLPRVDNGPQSAVLAPGGRGAATLWLLQDDDPGAWVPAEIVSIPPGQTTPLRTAWPFHFGVQRQDAATHPGSYVHGITPLS